MTTALVAYLARMQDLSGYGGRVLKRCFCIDRSALVCLTYVSHASSMLFQTFHKIVTS